MKSKRNAENLTKSVKELAKHQGAALVGVANIERFDPIPSFYDAPPVGFGPRDYLPEARSVISIAQPILNAVMDAPAAMMDKDVEMLPPDIIHEYFELLYNTVGHRTQDFLLEHIVQVVGQYLQSEGYRVMTFPTTSIHPKHPYGLDSDQLWEGPSQEWAERYLSHASRSQPFRYRSGGWGPFSHRHAATRAGLGEFGYINIVLTKEFGPRQRFNSIVTDAELMPDPLIAEQICLRDECRLCLDACPVGAIELREGFDKNKVFVDSPALTNPMLCSHRRDRTTWRDPKRCFYGDCNRICPIPAHQRDSKYLSKRLRSILDSKYRPSQRQS